MKAILMGLVMLGIAVPVPRADASALKVLYSFCADASGHCPDGSGPKGDLIADAAGNLYGTTFSGGQFFYGAVFKLSPPAAGKTAWTEKVIYSFKGASDGSRPTAGLVRDTSGNLYGVTSDNGDEVSFGTVFKLSPGVGGGAWKETVLYHFTGGADGARPNAALISDQAGNLYGTTEAGGSASPRFGTVFELSPPKSGKGAWTEKVLHSFSRSPDGAEPFARLVRDASGNLYGTTEFGGTVGGGNGTVFELSPPKAASGAWNEKVLYAFKAESDGAQPVAGLILAAGGVLYGTTETGGGTRACLGAGLSGCGTVFALTPPKSSSGTWTEKVLLGLNPKGTAGVYPEAALIADKKGNLYGTTEVGGKGNGTAISGTVVGFGTVFELSPPAANKSVWTEKLLYPFTGKTDGANPYAGVRLDAKGHLYGTTSTDGAHGGGTIYELTP